MHAVPALKDSGHKRASDVQKLSPLCLAALENSYHLPPQWHPDIKSGTPFSNRRFYPVYGDVYEKHPFNLPSDGIKTQ